jgi:hypothetical protein
VLEDFNMSNRLSMANFNSIETLHQSGHFNREIARLLGVDRGAVNRYIRQLRIRLAQKRPNPQTGSDNIGTAENQPKPQTGFNENAATENPHTEPAESPPGPVVDAFTLAGPVAADGLAKRQAILPILTAPAFAARRTLTATTQPPPTDRRIRFPTGFASRRSYQAVLPGSAQEI